MEGIESSLIPKIIAATQKPTWEGVGEPIEDATMEKRCNLLPTIGPPSFLLHAPPHFRGCDCNCDCDGEALSSRERERPLACPTTHRCNALTHAAGELASATAISESRDTLTCVLAPLGPRFVVSQLSSFWRPSWVAVGPQTQHPDQDLGREDVGGLRLQSFITTLHSNSVHN